MKGLKWHSDTEIFIHFLKVVYLNGTRARACN